MESTDREGSTPIYDYRYWILERFAEGKRRNPRWSLRAYARQLSVSPSTLSEILSGKRAMTRKMAMRMADRLGLSDVQTKLLIRSVVMSKLSASLPSDESINALADQSFVSFDVEKFKLISHWYHFAILSLSEVKGARYDFKWLSRRLGISLREAKDAFQRLERLKIVRRKRSGFEQVVRPLSIQTEGYEPAVRQFLRENLQKASDSLEGVPAPEREINAVTLAIDPKNIPRAREAIKRFRREMCELLERGEKKRVYTFAFQLFPVDIGNDSPRAAPEPGAAR